jgi:hypothetical protein
MKRLVFLLGVFALTLLALPASGMAQGYGYGYERDRDRGSRDNSRYLKRSVERVDRLSGQLKNDMDSALDRSRLNGRNREDQINGLVNDFHSAAARFRDRFDNGNLGRAQNEANQMLSLGWRIDEIVNRRDLGDRVESKWSQIRNDLQVIQNAYGDQGGYGYPRR